MVIDKSQFFLLAERYILSPRQRKLIRYLLSGRLEDRELAAVMGVARSTIQEQFNRIFKKMHARSRIEVMYKFISEAKLVK